MDKQTRKTRKTRRANPRRDGVDLSALDADKLYPKQLFISGAARRALHTVALATEMSDSQAAEVLFISAAAQLEKLEAANAE